MRTTFLASYTPMHVSIVVAAMTLATGAMADGAPRPFNWTGFYIGANAGLARADSDGANSVPCSTACPYFFPANAAAINGNGGFSTSDSAVIGGAQIGVNLQSGALVSGIEGDLNTLATKGSVTSDIRYVTAPSNGNYFTNSVETSWLATIRARLGLASGTNLFYLTGGLAFTDVKLSSSVREHLAPCVGLDCGIARVPGAGSSFVKDIKTGWTVGGGIEHALDRNWTIKGEYLFADFGKVTSRTNYVGSQLGTSFAQPIDHSADLTLHIFRAGINYRF